MRLRRVVVTGIGLVTPLGATSEASWDALLAGRSGLSAPGPELLCPGLPPPSAVALVDREALAAAARGAPWEPRRESPFVWFARAAAAEALAQAGWAPEAGSPESWRTGVAVGAGMSCTAEFAAAAAAVAAGRARRLSPFFVPKVLVNSPAGAVSIAHGLRGPCLAPSTACAAGAQALGDALRCVQLGDADVMVAGGAESCVDALTVAGFQRLRALSNAHAGSPEAASRPFDAGRDGFVLGEGAGVLVLEELEHARRRGARVLAEVAGFGMSADAFHVTAPREDGEGARAAMGRALAAAGRGGWGDEHGGAATRALVGYVNAHATSTPIGDTAERRAIGLELPGVAVSSTKGAIGHLLGAAGAVEAAFTVHALRTGDLPGTRNLEQPEERDSEDGGGGEGARILGPEGMRLEPGRALALSNSFGFGGSNCCVAFARGSPPPGGGGGGGGGGRKAF